MENLQEYIKVLLRMNECIESNTIGTNSVFNFCLENKIKLIYSATSASSREIKEMTKIYLLMLLQKQKI